MVSFGPVASPRPAPPESSFLQPEFAKAIRLLDRGRFDSAQGDSSNVRGPAELLRQREAFVKQDIDDGGNG